MVDDLFSSSSPFATLPKYRTWVVAYSGGLDSTVLLHAAHRFLQLQALSAEVRLCAVHIDHQISPNHARWVGHCRRRCRELNIPLTVETVVIDTGSGNSLELAAREARYQAFVKHLNAESVLLMAHHRDDQAETLLMRMFRGTGVRGAAGIPMSRKLGVAHIARPLHGFGREEIEAYAKHFALDFVQDESNEDAAMDRNYLRHNILPAVLKRWPQAIGSIYRFTAHMADNEALNRDLAATDFSCVKSSMQCYGENISTEKLLELPDYRRKNIYRFWLAQYSIYSPDAFNLGKLDEMVVTHQSGKRLILGGCEMRIHQESLYCIATEWLQRLTQNWHSVSSWTAVENLVMEGVGELSVTTSIGVPGLMEGEYRIDNRRNARECRVNGMTKSVSRILQEVGVPEWLRDRYPVVYSGEIVAAVGDVLICDDFKSDRGLALSWRYTIV